MNDDQNRTTSGAPRAATNAGRSMILSGSIGLLAMASLIAAVVWRSVLAPPTNASGDFDHGIWDLLFRLHDAGGIAQALLMIPGVYALHDLSRQASSRVARAMIPVGVGANLLLALCLALVFITQASDMLYMLPQAFVGVWLIITNNRLPATIVRGLKITGIIAGIGLIIVGIAYIGIVTALGPEMITIIGPAPQRADPVATLSTLNMYSHRALDIGTLLGVFTYPIWSILVGRKLLHLKH